MPIYNDSDIKYEHINRIYKFIILSSTRIVHLDATH